MLAGTSLWLRARPNCWKLDSTPTATSMARSVPVDGSRAPVTTTMPAKISAPQPLCQTAVVAGLSRRPSLRSEIIIIAPKKGEPSPNSSPAIVHPAADGFSSSMVPPNPTMTADQRRQPTLSPRSSGARKVTNSVSVWNSTVTSDSAIRSSAA